MNNGQPLISVIIPVYNVENYLHECVQSVLDQTYQHFEIILSDDGSTDNSGRICDELAAADSRIRVIHEENGGLSMARNRGMKIANGKFIVFIDSDDAIHPQMIERLVNIADNTDSDIVTTKKPIASPEIDWTATNPDAETIKTFKSEAAVRRFLMRTDNCAAWGKIYRKNVVDGLSFVPGIINEDEVFLADVYPRCHRFAVSDQLYCFYRSNPGSLSRTMSSKKFDMVKNAYVIDKKMAALYYDLTLERRYHLVTVCVDYCMQVVKHKAMRHFRKEYLEARANLTHHFWKNLFGTKLSLRYKLKFILACIK